MTGSIQPDQQKITYRRASRYPDLASVYAQCSGPGGLKLAEFMAEKMQLAPGQRLLDVGTNRGLQTCFLAKEYHVQVVGIDPWYDRVEGKTHIELLLKNAHEWQVTGQVWGVRSGVPATGLAGESFERIYSATTLEMVRGLNGRPAYLESLKEIWRLLTAGGIFGLAEPMHLPVAIPDDVAALVKRGPRGWADFFVTLDETAADCRAAGFEILEAAYAPDARLWWQEFARYDPFCRQDPDGDPLTIEVDAGRWLSFGYVIARKPGSVQA